MFKYSSFLELWRTFYSAEGNHFVHFGRGHHEEQFCEIIFNSEPVVPEEI